MRASLGVVLIALLALGTGGCEDLGDITGEGNRAPEARAGVDQAVFVGETVSLEGWGSSDPDGDDLTYAWTLLEKPDTSGVSLTSTGTEETSFVPDVPGTYRVELEVSDGEETDTDEAVVTAAWDMELRGSLDADTTLVRRAESYRVMGDLTINAAVVIEPGVTIVVESGNGIWIEGAGSLYAAGTATDSIRFIGSTAQAGSWDGLYYSTKDPDNVLAYAVVAHGGANGNANITVAWNGQVSVTNSLIHDGSTWGLDLDAEAGLPAFANNTFRAFTNGSILTDPQLLGSLDAATSYAAGGPIEVDAGTVTAAGTWKAVDTYYEVNGSINVEAPVVVQPGADFRFAQDVGLDVYGTGSFSAVGTSTDTIRFVGQNDVDGFWYGITFSTEQTANELSYVEVANGGGYGHGNVGVYWNGRAKVTHSLLRDAADYGLWLDGEATLAEFAGNTLTGNGIAAALIEAPHMGMMDGASTYVGNVGDYIEVNGGYTATAQTWAKTDVPFRVSSSITVDSPITIEAGARFVFEQDLGLYVDSNGTLTANGQATDRIYFTGAQEVAGFWVGIMFSTVSALNALDYIDIGFGGSGWDANLMVMWNGSLTVTNSVIHDATYGIYRDIEGALTATDNTYPNTTLEIFVD